MSNDPKVFVCLQITGTVDLRRVGDANFELHYDAHNDINVQGAFLGIRAESQDKEEEVLRKAADVLIRTIAALAAAQDAGALDEAPSTPKVMA